MVFTTSLYGVFSTLLLPLTRTQILASTFIIFILYSLVFLSLRGNIVADAGGIELRRIAQGSNSQVAELPYAHVTAIARKMLWYPISVRSTRISNRESHNAQYVIIVLPIASARLASVNGRSKVPNWVWLFSITCLFLSGA